VMYEIVRQRRTKESALNKEASSGAK